MCLILVLSTGQLVADTIMENQPQEMEPYSHATLGELFDRNIDKLMSDVKFRRRIEQDVKQVNLWIMLLLLIFHEDTSGVMVHGNKIHREIYREDEEGSLKCSPQKIFIDIYTFMCTKIHFISLKSNLRNRFVNSISKIVSFQVVQATQYLLSSYL